MNNKFKIILLYSNFKYTYSKNLIIFKYNHDFQ